MSGLAEVISVGLFFLTFFGLIDILDLSNYTKTNSKMYNMINWR